MPATFKRNQVVKFVYLQPRQGRAFRYGRIVGWRELSEDKLQKLNRYSGYRCTDSGFYRSKTLLTVESVDGSIQQYYDESIQQAKRGWKIVFAAKKFWKKIRNSN